MKNFLIDRGKAPAGSRHQPEIVAAEPTFRILTKKPIEPSAGETAANPRARSAKLRAAERTEIAARPDDPLAPLLARLPSLEARRGR